MRGQLHITVCGLPKSGNRMIHRMLERHGFKAEVRHYGAPKNFGPPGKYRPDRAVMPLRDLDVQWKSGGGEPLPTAFSEETGRVKYGRPGSIEHMHFAHYWPTMRMLAGASIPVLPVSYEAIIDDPDREGRRIVSFIDPIAIWHGWGVEIVDGNTKWLEAAP